MRISNVLLALAFGTAAFAPAHAQEEFEPEQLSVEAKVRPGPNIFVLDQSWKGSSRLNVLSADDLSVKGIISVGLVGQATFSPDLKTAYLTSAYAKRIVRGPTEAVLEEYDTETLKLRREIPISEKFAQTAPAKSALVLSGDGKFAFVQNATPATSVTVVDLTSGASVAEVPTPGCFAIFPAAAGAKFTTLCGDGTLASFTVAADGKASPPQKSAPIFDAAKDALFIQAERVGADLLFTSFNGNLYRVSDAGEAPKLVDKFSYVESVEGSWRPGGVEIMAYNPAHDVLFVTMHPGGKEGSHKDAATEIWAIKVADKKVLYRSAVHGVKSIAVTQGPAPVLFASDPEEGNVTRYEIDPEAKFAAKLTVTAESVGIFVPLVVAGE
ncbi:MULTISPECIES: amine dehydrogenase large subunit [unclassified Aureimonas]|uniref:amine dehydrogenase large subunit n=1 Tax=unclassified Aureimonas TaxID=2615206 RepID=UPI0006FBB14B|nr:MULTISPECIES: amine dehydrogenase large subunit [unclassified Aureimonas]KQT64048.1 hypothetical protein ASG62_03260 [Aureimonas sp. Leaf427]KQT81240.1 hypothetical protein ASG54_00530 [Aureimonas sp. Leaf460]